MEEIKMKKWLGASARVMGRSHEEKNIPCQDNVDYYIDDNIAVMALSDGAGSCSLSHIGSKIVVEQAIEILKNNFDRIYNMEALKAKRFITSNIVKSIIVEKNRNENSEVRDYSATLLFIAIKDGKFLVGHMGDGIIGYFKNNEIKVLSEPKNGETANSTYFVTMNDAEYMFDMKKGNIGEVQGFILMSDGAGNSLYNKNSRELGKGCITLANWMSEMASTEFTKILEENLENVLKSRTTDDCSIGMIYMNNKSIEELKEVKQSLAGELLEINDEKGLENFFLVYDEYKNRKLKGKRTSFKAVATSIKKNKRIVKRHIKRLEAIKIKSN